MSWQLVAILFAISAFEGVRRLATEDVVMRGGPFGSWRVANPIRLWRDWYLVSVLPPLFLTLVVSPDPATKRNSKDGRDVPQFTRSTWRVRVLRVLGALDFVALIFGIPWGVSRYGSIGFLVSLGSTLALSVAIAICSAFFLRGEGAPGKIAFGRATSFLSPFASPMAAEAVLAARMRRYPRLISIPGLLGEARFHERVRKSAYDVESATGPISGPWFDIAQSLSPSERARIVESAADGCAESERYCPRCGEKYLVESSMCSECGDIPLKAPAVLT